MKTRNATWTFLLLSISLLGIIALASCRQKTVPSDIAYYTCPMHPQIHRDQPGQCPICGMTLVPIKKEPAEGGTSDATAKEPGREIRIDPIRLQDIGMQTEEVKLRNLNKKISIQGKVAHDPDLWITQREYLIALGLADPALIKSAEEKLQLLGLSPEWIRLLRNRKREDTGFYLPVAGKPTFFEAFLYQGDINEIKVGDHVKISDLRSRNLGEGVLRALGTVIDMPTRTLRVLIQSDKPVDLKANAFVQLNFDIPLGTHLSVSKEAILFNGDHNMVYVETAPGKFLPRRIEIGTEGGNFYEVNSGLKAGEKVVTNGTFLLDSETQIKMGGISEHHH